MDLAKSLREVNNLPVMSEEKILEIRKIVGKDGITRELIIVDKLATRKVYNWEDVSDEVREANAGTFEIEAAYGGFDPVAMKSIRKPKSLRSLSATLRKGYGAGRGFVTDRESYRYDVSRRGW